MLIFYAIGKSLNRRRSRNDSLEIYFFKILQFHCLNLWSNMYNQKRNDAKELKNKVKKGENGEQ